MHRGPRGLLRVGIAWQAGDWHLLALNYGPEGTELVVVAEGDKALFNPYGVIAVDPAKNPNIKGDLADQFIDWIISVPTQEMIGAFGQEEFDQSLFIPDSQPWNNQ